VKSFKLSSTTRLTPLLGACFSFALLTGCGGSVAPEWEAFYSHQEDSIEWQRTVDIDSFGGIITTGQTINTGADRTQDALVAKHDKQGNLIWAINVDLGQPAARSDEATTDAVIDFNGNTYVVGTIYRPENPISIYGSFLLKVDSLGELAWSNVISDKEKTRDVELANGLIYTGGDATRVFDLEGNEQLSINHGDANVWDIEVDNQGNIYSAGYAFTSKHNANGILVWQLNNPEGLTHSTSLALTNDGGAVVAHLISSEDKIRVIKISNSGSVIWTKTINDPAASAGAMPGLPLVALDNQSNIIVINSNAQGRKTTKLNSNGNTLWSNTSKGNVIRQVITDADNNIYVYGSGKGEKYDPNGKSLLIIEPPAAAANTTGAITLSGADIFVASSIVNNGTFDLYIAKYLNR